MVLDSSLAAALPGRWPAIASVCSLLAKGLRPQVPLTAGAQRTGPAKFAQTLCSEPLPVKKVQLTSRVLAFFGRWPFCHNPAWPHAVDFARNFFRFLPF